MGGCQVEIRGMVGAVGGEDEGDSPRGYFLMRIFYRISGDWPEFGA
jgi:hypothetical protein